MQGSGHKNSWKWKIITQSSWENSRQKQKDQRSGGTYQIEQIENKERQPACSHYWDDIWNRRVNHKTGIIIQRSWENMVVENKQCWCLIQ